MSTFAFTARDTAGRLQRGTQEADSAGAAVGVIRGKGWVVVDVRPVAAKERSWGEQLAVLHPANWLSPASLDVELSLQQLAVLLRGGLTLLSAMRTVAEQCRRRSMTRIWEDVAERVQEGKSLAEALLRHKCFAPMVVQLIRVGEQTGTLEPVLRRAAEMLEKRRHLRNSLLTALTYPALVLIAAFGVTAFMVVSVIPKLQVFLAALGRKLPPMTQLLVDVSMTIQKYAVHAAVGTIAAMAIAITLYVWPPGRLAIDRYALRVPILGSMFRLAATALFSRALGMLIRSGVTLLEGLRTTETLLQNRYIRTRIWAARESVMQGGNLADPLRAPYAFTKMLSAMAAVGESTGTLDDVLEETARFHEEQLQMAIRRFSIIIEPVIVCVVGAIVGFVYISFFMALFAAAGPGGR